MNEANAGFKSDESADTGSDVFWGHSQDLLSSICLPNSNQPTDENNSPHSSAQYNPNSTSDALTNYEGQFQFEILHPAEDQQKANKHASWTYSTMLDELYVRMCVDCPVLVQIKGRAPPGSIIRATPYYQRVEDINDVPKRCMHHSTPQDESNKDHQHALQHLIRCNQPGTVYTTDAESGHMSTILPYIKQEASYLITYVIKFTCRTSCVGGMNRRPFQVLFSLEHNGVCLGRHMKKVKVCECPGRDRHKDEANFQKRTLVPVPSTSTPLEQSVKRACKRIGERLTNIKPIATRCKKTCYTIKVTSKATYNILSALVPVLEKNLGAQDSSDEEDDS